jgi:hypothetical protein
VRLHLTTAQNADLRTYLFDLPEQIAFLFLHLDAGDAADGVDARVDAVRFLENGDYLHRGRDGVELAEHVRPAMIRTGHEQGCAVVEAHAHQRPGPSTEFSSTDLDGLQQLGPHMTWRLPGRPYTALVLGPDSFDALQWHPDGRVTTIDAVVVDGEPTAPTGISLDSLDRRANWRPR